MEAGEVLDRCYFDEALGYLDQEYNRAGEEQEVFEWFADEVEDAASGPVSVSQGRQMLNGGIHRGRELGEGFRQRMHGLDHYIGEYGEEGWKQVVGSEISWKVASALDSNPGLGPQFAGVISQVSMAVSDAREQYLEDVSEERQNIEDFSRVFDDQVVPLLERFGRKDAGSTEVTELLDSLAWKRQDQISELNYHPRVFYERAEFKQPVLSSLIDCLDYVGDVHRQWASHLVDQKLADEAWPRRGIETF